MRTSAQAPNTVHLQDYLDYFDKSAPIIKFEDLETLYLKMPTANKMLLSHKHSSPKPGAVKEWIETHKVCSRDAWDPHYLACFEPLLPRYFLANYLDDLLAILDFLRKHCFSDFEQTIEKCWTGTLNFSGRNPYVDAIERVRNEVIKTGDSVNVLFTCLVALRSFPIVQAKFVEHAQLSPLEERYFRAWNTYQGEESLTIIGATIPSEQLIALLETGYHPGFFRRAFHTPEVIQALQDLCQLAKSRKMTVLNLAAIRGLVTEGLETLRKQSAIAWEGQPNGATEYLLKTILEELNRIEGIHTNSETPGASKPAPQGPDLEDQCEPVQNALL